MHGIASYAGFGAGLLAMTGLTVGLGRWARIGLGWFPLVVVVRAAVQLSVIALLLRGILAVPWTVAAFVVLMLTTASWTSGRRIQGALARPPDRGRRRADRCRARRWS